MSDAPERIWVRNFDGGLLCETEPFHQGFEYVRADVADAAYRRGIEDAAAIAADFVDGRLYKQKFPACSYHSREIAAVIRALADKPKEEEPQFDLGVVFRHTPVIK